MTNCPQTLELVTELVSSSAGDACHSNLVAPAFSRKHATRPHPFRASDKRTLRLRTWRVARQSWIKPWTGRTFWTHCVHPLHFGTILPLMSPARVGARAGAVQPGRPRGGRHASQPQVIGLAPGSVARRPARRRAPRG